jgi:alpha-acetolactate decarboxylase
MSKISALKETEPKLFWTTVVWLDGTAACYGTPYRGDWGNGTLVLLFADGGLITINAVATRLIQESDVAPVQPATQAAP